MKYIHWPALMMSFFTGVVMGALSQGTNVLFLPEDGRSWLDAQAHEKHNADQQQIAVESGECLPADLDTNGHWGGIVGGLQLCIRAKTNEFHVGSPVLVSVIIRNTSSNSLSRVDVDDGGESDFQIEDESGRHADPIPSPGLVHAGLVNISPMRQVKHEYNLSEKFNLPAGVYKICVRQNLIEQSQHSKPVATNIYSGILPVRVVSP